MITSSLVSMAYGRRIMSMDDPFIMNAGLTAEGLNAVVVPGAFLVEFIPLLRYLPSWVPGASATKHALKYMPFIRKMRDQPFYEVKAAVVRGLLGFQLK